MLSPSLATVTCWIMIGAQRKSYLFDASAFPDFLLHRTTCVPSRAWACWNSAPNAFLGRMSPLLHRIANTPPPMIGIRDCGPNRLRADWTSSQGHDRFESILLNQTCSQFQSIQCTNFNEDQYEPHYFVFQVRFMHFKGLNRKIEAKFYDFASRVIRR